MEMMEKPKKYISKRVWFRYFYQIENILKLKPQKVLEIGLKHSFVAEYLKKKKISATTLDINREYNPDIIASVLDMPFENDSFDVVVAGQVLEHLPFEDFSSALNEMKRVTRKYIIISLPHQQRTLLHFILKIPFLGKKELLRKIPLNTEMKPYIEGGHYWEIGRKAYLLPKIKKTISECNLKIVNDFIPYDIPATSTKHFHYFILEK